jgi:hypothetical protein
MKYETTSAGKTLVVFHTLQLTPLAINMKRGPPRSDGRPIRPY